MSTDYRALCAELVDALAEWQLGGGPPEDTADADLIDRARAALAQPEPVAPTQGEAVAVYTEVMAAHDCQTLGDMAEHFARAVLARWRTPTAQPVPVSERLPGAKDCDPKLQRCWWLYPGFQESWESCSRPREGVTHWLPHWALPVPTPTNNTRGTNGHV